jgi:hypothetical protein
MLGRAVYAEMPATHPDCALDELLEFYITDADVRKVPEHTKRKFPIPKRFIR